MPRALPARLPMTGRRQVRLAALAALTRAALAVRGVPVELRSPGDWSLPAANLPAIVLRTGAETKTSFNRGVPEFTTVCALEVKAVVEAPTAAQAQDDIEALWYGIENALLYDFSLVGMTQQFATVETALDIRAEGARHLAGIAASFACEFAETFDPTDPPPSAEPWPLNPPAPAPLERIGIHADTIQPADPTGTYPDPPFPAVVTPAPRTHGPDGRDEGALVITPQDLDAP
jgi:hypothetical protein